AAIERKAAEPALRQSELCGVGRDHDVAAKHHLEAAAQRVTVDAGDQGNVERAPERDAAEAVGPGLGPIFEALLARILEIGAEAERLFAIARVRRAANVRAMFEFAQDRIELSLGGRVNGVQPLRPVDDDACDATADVEIDAHAAPALRSDAGAPSTSSLCSPSLGGAWRISNRAADMSIGVPISRIGPASVRPASTIILLTSVCSSSSASGRVFTGAHRMSTASSRASQWALPFCRKRSRKIACSSARFSICRSKSAKRSCCD